MSEHYEPLERADKDVLDVRPACVQIAIYLNQNQFSRGRRNEEQMQ